MDWDAIILAGVAALGSYAAVLQKGALDAKAAWREHMRESYAAWCATVIEATGAYQTYLLEDALFRDMRENEEPPPRYLREQSAECHKLMKAASSARAKAVAARFVVVSSESNSELFREVGQVTDLILPTFMLETLGMDTTAARALEMYDSYAKQVDGILHRLASIERLFFDVRHLRP